jgi:UDP-N-acetylmuramoyl-L-alanyl-D-glutamate--2,6-diaminopimelate ligase
LKNATAQRIDLAVVLRDFAQIEPTLIQGMHLDSRFVRPGDAFVAIAGKNSHGLSYVEAAAANGAGVILYDPADLGTTVFPSNVQAIAIPKLKSCLGILSDRAYGEPSARLEVAAVTGTNGKTTCAWLYAICRDEKASYLGTLGAGRPPKLTATTHTTADVFSLNRALADFCEFGSRHAGIEVSSHALDQDRIAGVRIPIAAFTNLTRDHLDYHGTMAAYGAAKARLFGCVGVCHAVINVNDAFGRQLVNGLPENVEPTLVSVQGSVEHIGRYVVATDIDCRETGLTLRGKTHEGDFALETKLVGKFNAENLVVVLGMLLGSGVKLPDAIERLSVASAPPGRMEAFSIESGPLVVVDYAHTPDALEKVLLALRVHTRGDLYCIFGCGGDRDPGKRPIMAQVAEAHADYVIVTDDNPRTEDSQSIVSGIISGFSANAHVLVETDREIAIRSTVAKARSGDVVLVAGKGHEDYQIVGTEKTYFSDRSIANDLTRRAA